MDVQRRNPPGGSDTIYTDKMPARGQMGKPSSDETSERDLDGDPVIAELRKLYDGVVDEPMPDELLELLKKLDQAERSR